MEKYYEKQQYKHFAYLLDNNKVKWACGNHYVVKEICKEYGTVNHLMWDPISCSTIVATCADDLELYEYL